MEWVQLLSGCKGLVYYSFCRYYYGENRLETLDMLTNKGVRNSIYCLADPIATGLIFLNVGLEDKN